MLSNICPTTGIRYGVISCNSLDQDLVNDLFYGPQAEDLSYQAAYAEARAEAGSEYDCAKEEAEIAAAETDRNMTDAEQECFIETWFEQHEMLSDRDEFIDQKLEMFSDICQIDEPTIVGEHEGVKYQITWLAGAPLVWILSGPEGSARQLCSPCVPNAADLDGGFVLDSEIPVDSDGYPLEDGEPYACYCPPRDWLFKEI